MIFQNPVRAEMRAEELPGRHRSGRAEATAPKRRGRGEEILWLLSLSELLQVTLIDQSQLENSNRAQVRQLVALSLPGPREGPQMDRKEG